MNKVQTKITFEIYSCSKPCVWIRQRFKKRMFSATLINKQQSWMGGRTAHRQKTLFGFKHKAHITQGRFEPIWYRLLRQSFNSWCYICCDHQQHLSHFTAVCLPLTWTVLSGFMALCSPDTSRGAVTGWDFFPPPVRGLSVRDRIAMLLINRGWHQLRTWYENWR